jgi:hypothetical protein
MGDDGEPKKVSASLSLLGFTNANGYNITEVFESTYIGVYKPGDTFSAMVNPSGIFFAKAVPL